MVDEVITKQELIDAQKDAQSLDDFINGGDEQVVVTRLLMEYPTLANAIRQIYEKGGKFYPTLADANADIANIRTDVYVITGDNGAYYKATAEATALTKSDYDPLTQAKVYSDSLKTLLDLDIQENRDDISSLLVSLHQVIKAIENESDDTNAKIDLVTDSIDAILSNNSVFEDDLTHHLVAIHQLVKNVAEINSSNGIANARGAFKYGNNYAANEVFTHASGTYLVLEPVINAQISPDKDARYECIVAPDWAAKVAEMSVKSVSITTNHPSSEVPHTISPDGMKMWATYSMGKLLESTDFGKTWNMLHDFGDLHRVVWVRQTDNGELLLRTETYVYEEWNLVDVRQRVRRSVGYGTPSMTFETCIDIQNRRNVLFHNGWSISTHKNIILIAEYGAKGDEPWGGQTLPAELSARYAYMSLDYGVTWTTIFDAMEHIADTNGVHLHGICYDPYWERIWINCGDRVSGLWYSDDLGETWTESEYFERDSGGVAPADKRQNVGIIALPTCILFGTDYAQDGVQRIDRAHGKHIAGGKYPVDVAHAIDFGQGHTRAQVCHIINHTYQKENAPIIFGFCSETPVAGTAPAGTVVVTYDGWNFKQIWQDELWQPSGKGLQSLAGITLLNEIIIKSVDSRSPAANTYTKITLKV